MASILNGTGLRYVPFLAARLVHGLLSAVLLLVLWKPVTGSALSAGFSALPVAAGLTSAPGPALAASLVLLGLLLGAALLLSLLVWLLRGFARRLQQP